MEYFPYGDIEITYLKSKDKILGDAIDKIGFVRRNVNTDLLSSLVTSIIGQQISISAAKTINSRLTSKIGIITASGIIGLGLEALQSCGITMKKANYIYELCHKIMNKEIDLELLRNLNDDDVIKNLIKIKGIGKWTAEMFLISSLLRKNIISFDDLAIHRGMRMLYNLDNINKETFSIYRDLYSPYATVASIYLWQVASGKFGYIDPKQKQNN